jgi:hypothetical protein
MCRFLAPKSRRRLFQNDSAFLASVGFLKMTRLFEKADRLLAMSRGNTITGLTFSRHSSGVSGSFLELRTISNVKREDARASTQYE